MDESAANFAKSPYFVALIPPELIQEYVNEVKHHFAAHYNSRAALKSPPHITLQPPFEWAQADLPGLERCLEEFAAARSPFSIHLDGFAAFPPNVIYMNVIPSPNLLNLQQMLLETMAATLGIIDPQAKTRSFTPHITVGFRDLTREAFTAAWEEFHHRPVQFDFTATHLTLLRHTEAQWHAYQEFPLNS